MATPEDFREKGKIAKNINTEHRKSMTLLERFAIWITKNVGTMGFFFLLFFWTIIWLGWNTMVPAESRFDPFPAFVFWLFISNMIQLFLLPLIMVGQNLQGRHAELRAENDFEINQKSEIEIEAILQKLQKQEELELKILKRIEELERKEN